MSYTDQGKLANGLVEELLAVVYQYSETMYMSTAVGCLELVKQQLINDSVEDGDD
jgi:hypothetical protein